MSLGTACCGQALLAACTKPLGAQLPSLARRGLAWGCRQKRPAARCLRGPGLACALARLRSHALAAGGGLLPAALHSSGRPGADWRAWSYAGGWAGPMSASPVPQTAGRRIAQILGHLLSCSACEAPAPGRRLPPAAYAQGRARAHARSSRGVPDACAGERTPATVQAENHGRPHRRAGAPAEHAFARRRAPAAFVRWSARPGARARRTPAATWRPRRRCRTSSAQF